MGMFDYLRCELPMPDGRDLLPDSIQTKSLWCCMDHFTITATGRLIYHKWRYAAAPRGTKQEPVHVADIDLEYHGDLEIHGVTREEVFVSYAVRFTHGRVEWIRPTDDLPEIHQLWLTERGR